VSEPVNAIKERKSAIRITVFPAKDMPGPSDEVQSGGSKSAPRSPIHRLYCANLIPAAKKRPRKNKASKGISRASMTSAQDDCPINIALSILARE
jgi:hypothetical protein